MFVPLLCTRLLGFFLSQCVKLHRTVLPSCDVWLCKNGSWGVGGGRRDVHVCSVCWEKQELWGGGGGGRGICTCYRHVCSVFILLLCTRLLGFSLSQFIELQPFVPLLCTVLGFLLSQFVKMHPIKGRLMGGGGRGRLYMYIMHILIIDLQQTWPNNILCYTNYYSDVLWVGLNQFVLHGYHSLFRSLS